MARRENRTALVQISGSLIRISISNLNRTLCSRVTMLSGFTSGLVLVLDDFDVVSSKRSKMMKHKRFVGITLTIALVVFECTMFGLPLL